MCPPAFDSKQIVDLPIPDRNCANLELLLPDAASGQLPEVPGLIRVDPTQISAGLDLAFLECRLGQVRSVMIWGEAQEEQPGRFRVAPVLSRGWLRDQICKAWSGAAFERRRSSL